jgi:hypothetical protein
VSWPAKPRWWTPTHSPTSSLLPVYAAHGWSTAGPAWKAPRPRRKRPPRLMPNRKAVCLRLDNSASSRSDRPAVHSRRRSGRDGYVNQASAHVVGADAPVNAELIRGPLHRGARGVTACDFVAALGDENRDRVRSATSGHTGAGEPVEVYGAGSSGASGLLLRARGSVSRQKAFRAASARPVRGGRVLSRGADRDGGSL